MEGVFPKQLSIVGTLDPHFKLCLWPHTTTVQLLLLVVTTDENTNKNLLLKSEIPLYSAAENGSIGVPYFQPLVN
jgi:hypothetical protein